MEREWGEGDVIVYDHPDRGRCAGSILRLEGDRALVQDHGVCAKREWVEHGWLVRVVRCG